VFSAGRKRAGIVSAAKVESVSGREVVYLGAATVHLLGSYQVPGAAAQMATSHCALIQQKFILSRLRATVLSTKIICIFGSTRS
jgi:hypothetical protein